MPSEPGSLLGFITTKYLPLACKAAHKSWACWPMVAASDVTGCKMQMP